jgi:dienelactone hydrolase
VTGPLKVYPSLITLIAAITGGAGLAQGQVLEFRSATYADFRQVLVRAAPTATPTVPATLRFPDQRRDRYPAVVVVHTIGGYQAGNEGWHAAEFRKAGIATLTYDSFAARGLSQAAVIGARAGPPLASAVADAFAALQMLAAHPRIDGSRIAIVGFSFGGEVAHLTAFEPLRAALGAGRARFAGHVAFYPAGVYGVMAGPGAYSGAPILMLLGDRDDNFPVAKVEGYVRYAKAAGHPAPIDVVIYPGAYHAWTVPNLGSPRFYSQYGSTRKCPLILLGRAPPALLVDGLEKPIDPDSLGACMGEGRGYSMGYDASLRTRSSRDTVAFLQRHLKP